MPKLPLKNISARLISKGPGCWLILMLLCLLPVLMACQEKAEKTPAQTQSKAQGKTQAPEVIRATLDNGLRVVIVRNRLARGDDGDELSGRLERGAARVPRHGPRPGTHDVPRQPGLSAGQLANITAAMGGEFNADTQQTVTQYFFTVPADDLELALHIEAIRMRDVLDSRSSGTRSAAPSSRRWPRICPTRSTSSTPSSWRPCSRGRRMPTTPWAPSLLSTGPPAPCSRSSMRPGTPPTTPSW